MATQRCPKCGGYRIRSGYKPTPFLLRIIGIYNLLCDDCNWLFRGFAIPGTVSNRTRRYKKHKSKTFKEKESLSAMVLYKEKGASEQNVHTVDEISAKEDSKVTAAKEANEVSVKESDEIAAKENNELKVKEDNEAGVEEDSKIIAEENSEVVAKEDKQESVNPDAVLDRKKNRKRNRSRTREEKSQSV